MVQEIFECARTFKNLPLTLARRPQLFQAAVLRENFERNFEYGPKEKVNAPNLTFSYLFPNEINLVTSSWVKINGIKYVSHKCFLVIRYNEENLPEFTSLHTIVLKNNVPMFVCKKIVTVHHDMFLMAYEIEITDEFILIFTSDVFSHEVFHAHQCRGKKVIIVKKALGDLH